VAERLAISANSGISSVCLSVERDGHTRLTSLFAEHRKIPRLLASRMAALTIAL
jgi:hypothetical protein